MKRLFVRAARRLGWLSLAICLGLLTGGAGCPGDKSNRYTIRITPAGDSLDREIRIESIEDHGDSVAPMRDPHLTTGLQDRVWAAYRVTLDPATHRAYTARGRFGKIPDDVGNSGSWLVERSPLGSKWTYHEQLRGMDDPGEYLRRQFEISDSLAGVVAGWLRFELVTQQEYPRVSQHIERELALDARMVLSDCLVNRDSAEVESGAWLLSLSEKHPLLGLYLLALGNFDDSDDATSTTSLARARSDLALRLGLTTTSDRDRVLGFLSKTRRASASLQRYLAATSVDGSSRLDIDALTSLWMRGNLPAYLEDDITVELALRGSPETTNGTWDSTASVVRWFAPAPSVKLSSAFVPMICYANWSVPDTVSQRRLFGRVALKGSELIEYISLYNAIEPERRAEWDRMLMALKPGQLEPLKRFSPHDAAGVAGNWAGPLQTHLANVLAPPRVEAPAKPKSVPASAKPKAVPPPAPKK